MKQLPGTDSLFLSMETEEVHGHVGALLVLDPSEAPGFGFERFRDTFASRIGLAPKFGWMLREVPFGLDRPFWVEDSRFDVANHLHRIAVPPPGGMRELADLCGYLFSHKLDRRKPLWEMWYIDGLADGRVAVFAKTHHCMADGVSGADLGMLLCDLEPNPPARPEQPARPTPKAARTPGDLELLATGIGNLITTPLKIAGYAGRLLRRGLTVLSHASGENAPPLPTAVPRFSFNGNIGPRRGFACASVSLEQMQLVRKELGVKLNDVVIELCGTAMARYAEALGEPLERPIVVGCPISTRDKGDNELGNRMANMVVSCATDVRDPIERVLRIHRNANAAKEMIQDVRSTPIPSMGDTVPPSLINLAFRGMLAMADQTPLPLNALVSNVPGPPIPLYAAGSRIEALYPMSILASGQGLNVTVLSYIDRLDFGLTVDPDLVPDPWWIAKQIPLALDALVAAVRARSNAPAASAKPEAAEAPQREPAAELPQEDTTGTDDARAAA